MQRRSLIGGLLALAAPAVIRTPGLLMPVKPSHQMFMLEDFKQMFLSEYQFVSSPGIRILWPDGSTTWHGLANA